MLIDGEKDTSEYWRETEVLSLVMNNEADIDYDKCNQHTPEKIVVQFPSLRTVRPICRTNNDFQLCPQCPRFNNQTECDLFRDSCNRRSYRFEPPTSDDCPLSCRGWECSGGQVPEERCPLGAFLPDRETCNCCGRCSTYQQLNQKCAEFKKTVHVVNGSRETEVEEEFLEPGCDDGLVCRQGLCQDIHSVPTPPGLRRKRDEGLIEANEPCKKELKYFKKKYGKDGHLHYNAPQCTPLWLYAPVQCRRFVCYCSLEDGTFIQGIRVPRVEVSNMNCDCVREKCRTGSDVECDGYGNYKEAMFSPHLEVVRHVSYSTTTTKKNSLNFRTGYEAALPAKPIPF
ncbi:unnamed protein product [Danaus chrysippus]|uniref:(African queen) hypothetical protein n=1 Tax=Danaus chrysippus TaxID=151541 RepID=A0A8J2QT80_9NEOP|nr:unnamed protein product [Danaus chrysippus]